jgi:sec-independent protein translocase protein TatA
MGFLGIGTWEILLILILALIILGPGKLTDFARTLGKTVRAIRKASADLTTAVTRELEATKNEPPPSQPKQENNVKTGETPPATNQTTATSQDDQPTKPGGTSAAK